MACVGAQSYLLRRPGGAGTSDYSPHQRYNSEASIVIFQVQ